MFEGKSSIFEPLSTCERSMSSTWCIRNDIWVRERCQNSLRVARLLPPLPAEPSSFDKHIPVTWWAVLFLSLIRILSSPSHIERVYRYANARNVRHLSVVNSLVHVPVYSACFLFFDCERGCNAYDSLAYFDHTNDLLQGEAAYGPSLHTVSFSVSQPLDFLDAGPDHTAPLLWGSVLQHLVMCELSALKAKLHFVNIIERKWKRTSSN